MGVREAAVSVGLWTEGGDSGVDGVEAGVLSYFGRQITCVKGAERGGEGAAMRVSTGEHGLGILPVCCLYEE